MSGLATTSDRAGSLTGEGSSDALGRPAAGARRFGMAEALIVALTAMGLALRLYQLLRPGYLLGVTEYDDAVDFGSAVRLVHGFLPYRDFVLVQPPGITLVLAPVALLSKAVGLVSGFAVARVLTVCASATTIAMAGLLVRGRGALAVLITCGLLAVYPDGIAAAHTVLLEPWLAFFCLLGALAVFDGERLASGRRRLIWGGVAFGFAGAIKVWAVFPVVMILVLAVRALPRRGWLSYLGGVAAGFGVAVLPFFAAAPRAFYRDVVVAQLTRVDIARVPIRDRVTSLAGLNDLSHPSPHLIYAVAVALALFVGACLLAAAVRDRRPPPALECFVVLTAAVVLAAFLWPPDYYGHYAAFFGPFLALSLALPVSRLVGRRPRQAWFAERTWLAMAGLATAIAVLVLGAMARGEVHRIGKLSAGSPGAAIQKQIPAGACVITDLPAMTLVSDRFNSTEPGCYPMLDPIGTDYALGHGHNGVTGAGRTPAVQAVWLDAFRHAQYVWISCAPAASPGCDPWTNRRIPWTPAVLAYFHAHFRPVPGSRPPAHVFVRVPA